jgi:hypothetical protein
MSRRTKQQIADDRDALGALMRTESLTSHPDGGITYGGPASFWISQMGWRSWETSKFRTTVDSMRNDPEYAGPVICAFQIKRRWYYGMARNATDAMKYLDNRERRIENEIRNVLVMVVKTEDEFGSTARTKVARIGLTAILTMFEGILA